MKNFWKLVHPLTSVGASSLCRGHPPVLCCQIQLLWLGRCLCLAWKATDGYGASGHQVSELKPPPKKKYIHESPLLTFWPLYQLGICQTHVKETYIPLNLFFVAKLPIWKMVHFRCREIVVHIFIQIDKKVSPYFYFRSTHTWFELADEVLRFTDKSAFNKDIYLHLVCGCSHRFSTFF